MFELINTVMRMFRAKAPMSAVRLGEAADTHVHAYWDHLYELEWKEGRAEYEAEKAARDAIIAWCDDLDA